MSLIDPIKYLIKDLSIDSDIKTFVNKTTDPQIEGSTSGQLDIPRIFLETLKMWDKNDNNCYGITVAKQRFGSGKNPMDQTVEFAMEIICWSNRGTAESILWDLWSFVDDSQTITWAVVDDSQTITWSAVDDAQSVTWEDIAA